MGEAYHQDHTFGQDAKQPGEFRTFIVIIITAIMMVVEISAGILFNSMALLADGLHMASHAAALSINAFAYIYARKNARNRDFSFGTGKVNALGGYTGAILLAVFALLMGWESANRFINPEEIVFNQAILVAVIGLVVNGISVFILGVKDHYHDHDHNHNHDHEHSRDDGSQDHNLRSAYLHVLTDALTSVLAIIALLMAKYFGAVWMDPLMGVVGAVLVARWSIGLLRSTSAILLDKQAGQGIEQRVREVIESDGISRIEDFHVWSIGPKIFAAILSIRTSGDFNAADYRARVSEQFGFQHVSIEVHHKKRD
jgi:cation diffusion facilitator family transporter